VLNSRRRLEFSLLAADAGSIYGNRVLGIEASLEKREWKKEVGLISIFRHLVSKPVPTLRSGSRHIIYNMVIGTSVPKTQFPASSRASIYVVR